MGCVDVIPACQMSAKAKEDLIPDQEDDVYTHIDRFQLALMAGSYCVILHSRQLFSILFFSCCCFSPGQICVVAVRPGSLAASLPPDE